MGDSDDFSACRTRKERAELLAEFFMRWRPRLRAMFDVRLDPRLRQRVDPSDILQEAFLEASRRLEEYIKDAPMPLYLWLRRIAGQRLVDLYRHHLKAKARDARRERPLGEFPFPEASSKSIAARLAAEVASPSEKAARAELRDALQKTLDAMDAIDREILTLRHLEELTSAEAAQVLGIEERAASKRYVRALKRLREVLPLKL